MRIEECVLQTRSKSRTGETCRLKSRLYETMAVSREKHRSSEKGIRWLPVELSSELSECWHGKKGWRVRKGVPGGGQPE